MRPAGLPAFAALMLGLLIPASGCGASGASETGWLEVRRSPLVVEVEVEGSLMSRNSRKLGPPRIPGMWEFKIAFMAPEGAEVEEGEPVLGFDTTELEEKLDRLKAERDEAAERIEKRRAERRLEREALTAQLADARARLRKARLKADVPEALAASRELEEARLDMELAAREVAYLEAKLQASESAAEAELEALARRRDRAAQRVVETEAAIARMTVPAPTAGTVVYIPGWRGEKKSVGETCWVNEKVLEVPDLSAMVARGMVDEPDSAAVHTGQRVRFRLDAHPDLDFFGRVTSIRDTVQRKSWREPQKVVRLDIEPDRQDPTRMRPGMRFRGVIEVERLEDRLVIPPEAVLVQDGASVVHRRRALGEEVVPVRLGRRGRQGVEVLEGLREGDWIRTGAPEAEDRT